MLKPGHAGDAAMVKALQDHVKATIAPFKYPREIEFTPACRDRNRQAPAIQTEANMKLLQPPGWAPPAATPTALPPAAPWFLWGQIGWNAEQQFETDDFIAQTAQALRNVAAVLREAGAGPETHGAHDLVRGGPRGVHRAAERTGEAYREVMGRNFPAMTCVEVSALVEKARKVEIEVTAVVPD